MSVFTNIYPPIVNTSEPSFVRTRGCRIYFSLAQGNQLSEIKHAHIVIINQQTNLSEFDSALYPTGIKISNINIDTSVVGDKKYYVTILPQDLKSKVFNLNEIYKVQIRLASTEASDPPATKIANWLSENLNFFSEWSTVCLVRGIEQPIIKLQGFEEYAPGNEIAYLAHLDSLIGRMYYAVNNGNEKEYLYKYRVQTYLGEEKLYDSQDILANEYNRNEINHVIKYLFSEGSTYELRFSFETNNGYSETQIFNFVIFQNSTERLAVDLSAAAEPVNGRVRVEISASGTEEYLTNAILRRSSEKSDFLIWEDVNTVVVSPLTLPLVWYDLTVESGISYRYAIQPIDKNNQRGLVTYGRGNVRVDFEDIFLIQDGLSLKLEYNPSIASFQYKVLDGRADTLGSKFPYITRNGAVKYREFPLSGLISYQMDTNNLFANITEEDEYKKEKIFREKVMDFLYDNKIKLFKSNTEGNILVRLMNIVFQPVASLGRMIYSFNCVAVEMAECSTENYIKHNVQAFNQPESLEESNLTEERLGQLILDSSSQETELDLLKLIKEKALLASDGEIEEKLTGLKWIRVNFLESPYPIRTVSDGLVEGSEEPIVGHILTLNGSDLVVGQYGYEVTQEEDAIISLRRYKNEPILIDYIAEIELSTRSIPVEQVTSYNSRVSQIAETILPETSIINMIYEKHTLSLPTYFQKIGALDSLSLECLMPAVILLKFSGSSQLTEYVISDRSYVELNDLDNLLLDCVYVGVRLTPAAENKYVKYGEYTFGEDILNPEEYNVYGNQIYFQGEFYPFEDGLAKIPVDMVAEYYFDLVRGEY